MKRKSWFLGTIMLLLAAIGLAGCGPQGQVVQGAPSDWLTYTDTEAGYSFQYPPDVELRSVPAGDARFGYVYLSARRGGIWHQIQLNSLENPERLAIEAFVQTERAVRKFPPGDMSPLANYARHARTISIAGHSALQVERSPDTWLLTSTSKYATYIPYGDIVIAAYLGPGSKSAGEDWEPTSSGIELYNQVLSTFQFLTPVEPIK